MAQNNTITVTPNPLPAFCVTSNSSPAPPAQTLSVTSNSTSAIGYNANAFPNWIQLNGGGTVVGSTATNPTITVTILPAAYANLGQGASATGTIQVNSTNGNPINIPVTVNVSSTCTTSTGLTAVPSSITLTASQTSQQITINGVSGATVTATPNYGGQVSNWFTVPASFTTGQTVSVSLLNLSIPVPTTGSIVFSSNGQSVTVPVTFTNTTAVTPNVTSVTLSPSVQTASVTVSGPTGSTIVASPSYGNGASGWFAVTPASIISGNAFTITLQNASVASGTVGTVTFTQSGTSNSGSIQVIFSSSGTANFSLSTTSISVPTFASNASTPYTQSVTVNGLAGQYTAQVSSGNGPGGWLSTTQPGNQPPTPFTITVSPAGLTPGILYTGTVTVTQVGTNSSIPVTVTASVGSGGFSYSPNPLTFPVAAGTTTAQNQTLTITGPNGSTIGLTAVINNGTYQWLSFNGSTSTTGVLSSSQFQTLVTVNPVGLTAGQTYSGSIQVTQNGATVLSIPVSVTTAGAPTLTVAPSSLSFSWQVGTASPTTQTISVTSPAGTQVSFTPSASTSSCGTNWLVISPLFATTTPGVINVSINTAGFTQTNTTCSGNIQISAPGASTSVINIPVSVQVSTNPLLILSPSSLTFNSQPNSGVPQSQTVQVTSTTPATPLSFTTSVNPATSGGPLFATVSTSSASTPSTITVGVNSAVLATLAPGTYVDNILLSAASAGNPSITLPVTLVVANTASLMANPSSLVINYQPGTFVIPPTQLVTISSSGAPISYTVGTTSNCNNFLTVSQTSGNTLSSSGANGTTINVTPNVSGLTAPMTCTGSITLTNTANNATLTIPVTLNVVSSSVIDIGVNNVTGTAAVGSTSTISSTVPLTASDGATSISFTALGNITTGPQTWLTVSPNTGFTPNQLTVTLNPSGLSAGTYTGTISVADNRSGSPVPTQTIPVTLIVASQVVANPASLTFTATLNAANPASQNVTLTGIPTGSTISATASALSCGSNWLSATPTGNVITVSVTSANLSTTAGAICTGNISVIVPGASNSPLNIPVTVNVSSTALSLSTTNLTFNYVSSSGSAPAAQTVQLTSTAGTSTSFLASASSTPAGLVTVTPTTGTTNGTTPVTLTVGLSPTVLASLGQGTYTGTVTISSSNTASVTLNVTVNVTTPPPPSLTQVVNAATQQPGSLSPGELISIYGTNLGPTTALTFTLSNGKVPTNLGGTQVTFDGIAAPLIYVSSTQINAIVPYEIAGRVQTTMVISSGGVSTSGLTLRVDLTSPGIFTLDSSGKGQGAVLNQNGTVNGPSNPAPKNSTIVIYATGEGQITPPGTTGAVNPSIAPFPKPTANVTLNFLIPGSNGQTQQVPATITFAGEAPTLVSGVLQINAIVPSTVPTGTNTVVLTVGNNTSPSVVTVQVQ